MVIDVITYNGEKDLFDLRYNLLKDYVDEFIVVEFDKTFSGKKKERLFLNDYPHIPLKVAYYYFSEDMYGKYRTLAESSQNTIGAAHWKREFMQKESIKDALVHLQDDDLLFIGDCDEVWKPMCSYYPYNGPRKLKLRVYTYYLNNRSSEDFWGTLLVKYKDVKNECLNHLRVRAEKTKHYKGWHFTSMANQLAQKLEDSYTDESYNTAWVRENLEENIQNNKDFLGRPFTYTLDESNWPQHLKENISKYEHLCRKK